MILAKHLLFGPHLSLTSLSLYWMKNTATGIWFFVFQQMGFGPTRESGFFFNTWALPHKSSPNKQIQHYFDLECSYAKMVFGRLGVFGCVWGKGPNHRSHIQ
jgi:hypothetical protein